MTPRARWCSRWWLRWRCSVSTVIGSRSTTRRLRRVFGHADHFDAVDHGGGLVHGHRAARQVEVGPAERNQFAATHAGQREEAEHRRVAVAVDRLEEAGQLARRPDRHLRCSGAGGGQRRGARQAGDVAGHDAGALGVVEQLVERGVDVVHAAHRQAPAAATARPQQLGIHRVEVGGAQLLELDIAEPRQHVVREHAAVALQRRRLAALVGQTVEPRLDGLGQRRAARGDEAAALVGGEEAGQLGLRIALRAERSLQLTAAIALSPRGVDDPRRGAGGSRPAVDRAAGHARTVLQMVTTSVTTSHPAGNRSRTARTCKPSTRTSSVPPAGFEPATHGLGNRRSIP